MLSIRTSSVNKMYKNILRPSPIIVTRPWDVRPMTLIILFFKSNFEKISPTFSPIHCLWGENRFGRRTITCARVPSTSFLECCWVNGDYKKKKKPKCSFNNNNLCIMYLHFFFLVLFPPRETNKINLLYLTLHFTARAGNNNNPRVSSLGSGNDDLYDNRILLFLS